MKWKGHMVMKIRTVEHFVREVFISLKRNNWMSFASIGTVAVSLLILGMFLIVVLNLNKMAASLESQVQISVYLQDDLKQQDIDRIEGKIKDFQGIATITYIDKDKALERFKERLGDQKFLLTALGDTNPLPNAFEVTVQRPDFVKTLSESISQIDGVESAKFGQDVVEHLFDLTRMVRLFGLGIMVVLAGATVFIISNTIRLTVFARRKEIAIMKYVGATDWFIRWPFLLEGMVLGFLGGAIATIILRGSYSAVTARVYDTLTFLPLIPEYPFLNYISIAILISGTFIGALGSTISLKRFLKV
jgi:cell division transport system permease protein